MRFMLLVKSDPEPDAERIPGAGLQAVMGRYGGEMSRAGVLLEQGGLHPRSKGALVRMEDGKTSVVDGPFAEVEAIVGGYAIIQATSKVEAIEHAKRFLRIHADLRGQAYRGTVEVRQMLGAEDFAPPLG